MDARSTVGAPGRNAASADRGHFRRSSHLLEPAMITRILGASVALGTIVLAGATYVDPLRAPDSLCLDGAVPVVWPLGDSGFVAQRLLNSHGQYLQFDADLPFVHEGVDIAACPGDPVYAVETGTVDLISDDGGLGYAYLLVRDDDEPALGWKYMHLKNIVVEED